MVALDVRALREKTERKPAMSESNAQPSDYGAMWDMVTAYRASQLARVAATLSLPEHLTDGAKAAEEIAKAESTDPDATFRILPRITRAAFCSDECASSHASTRARSTIRPISGSVADTRRFVCGRTSEVMWSSPIRVPWGATYGRNIPVGRTRS